jgi:hypothetical protein
MYQQLNPLAAAVAAACTELLAALLIALPMLSMGGRMMGGQTGMMGGSGPMIGFAAAWWLGGAILFAVFGAVFAWIYNAVIAASSRNVQPGGTPHATS